MLKLFDPILSIALRVLFTCISAGLIGYERGLEGRAAGFRTHILVALGACIVMCVDQYLVTMINPNADPARLGAQVINGIGFLGAGTILANGKRVTGRTLDHGMCRSCIRLRILRRRISRHCDHADRIDRAAQSRRPHFYSGRNGTPD